MKILQIVAGRPEGGLGKHLIDLANAQSAHQQLIVIAQSSFGPSLSPAIEHIAFELKGAHANPFKLYALFRYIKQAKPDIVHAHGNEAAKLIGLLKPFLSAKTIGTVHWLLKKAREKAIYGRLDAVIGVTADVLAGISHTNTISIFNGVSPNMSATADLTTFGLDNHCRPLAIAVGRIEKVKGYDVLLNAWQGIDANLAIVGEGKQLTELKQLAVSLGIADKVHFLGNIPNASALFQAVDLVVVSSLHEGFCYVLAEALMSNKPVISTAIPLAKIALPHDWLATPGDVPSLHKQLLRATSDLSSLDNSLQKSYTWAAEALTIEAMTHNTLAFYKTLLKP